MIQSYKKEITRRLSDYYSVEDAEEIAKRLLEEAFVSSYPMLVISPPKDTQFAESRKIIDSWVGRLVEHEPLQYILGYADFDGMVLRVAPGVLIPRPETEYLCELLRREAYGRDVLHAIDLCTGSGCLALSMARSFVSSTVEAVDLSDSALGIARLNIDNHGDVGSRVILRCADILSPDYAPKYDLYDVVVSNPPYVTEREKGTMMPHVSQYEPEMALFVPDHDPLLFYKSIVGHFAHRLSDHGFIAMEINQAYGAECAALCKAFGLTARVERDQYGRDRFVFARREV